MADPPLLGVESGTDGRTCGKRASLQGLTVSTFTGSSPMGKTEKNWGSGAERDTLRSRCVTVVVEARDRSFGCPRCSTVELNPNRENALDRDVQIHVFCGPSPQLRGPRLTERR